MISTANNPIQQLKDTFQSFWNRNLRIESVRDGFVIAPPVMDANGWQIVLHLESLTPGKWRLSDRGKTLSHGLPGGAKGFKDRLEDLGRFYRLEREGLEFFKIVPEPLDAVEIQVFAEGLVAVSHVVRHSLEQMKSPGASSLVEDRVSSFFHSRRIDAMRDYKLQGKVETEIMVDFFVPNERPLAVEVVKRARKLRPYMEQWGWRWSDLKNGNPDLVRAMVFDPDSQQWDESALRIGREVCELFIPYTETERLAEYVSA